MTEQVKTERTNEEIEDANIKAMSEEDKKKTVGTRIENLKKKEQLVKTVKRRANENGGRIVGDDDSDAKKIADALSDILHDELIRNTTLPEPVKEFLTELSKHEISRRETVYLSSLIIEIIKTPDIFQFTSENEQGETDFEKKLREIYNENEDAGEYLRMAIGATAAKNKLVINGKKYERQYIDDRIKNLRDKTREVKKKEVDLLADQAKKAEDKREKANNTEMNNLLSFFEDIPANKDERQLIVTMYGNQEQFWNYVRGLMWGQSADPNSPIKDGIRKSAEEDIDKNMAQINEQYLKKGKTTPDREILVTRLAEEKLSDELRNRIRRLIAKLYRTVDTKDFRTPWGEASKLGSFYKNPDSVTNEFYNKLTQMEEYTPPSDLKNLSFFRTKQEEHTVQKKVVSRDEVDPTHTRLKTEGDKAVREESHTYLKPLFVPEKITTFADYMKYVQNSVRTEVEIRRFFHDARALPYLELGQNSYWQQLAGFAQAHLNAADIDDVFTLDGSDNIKMTSQMWDKINELSYAKNNWITKPLTNIPDPKTRLTDIDTYTRNYLRQLLKAQGKDDWEIERILALGIGDNFGITLRALTTGAMADPALKEDGTPSSLSYGTKDSAIYESMNYIMHVMGRWDSESQKMAGLGWLPLEGKNLKSFADTWDFTKLLDEMKKSQAAFVAGRNPDDIDKKVLRLFDITNIGRVGSIYDRAGFRTFYAYEGWLVLKDNVSHDIGKSWRAVEHIGIEAMKDFVGMIKVIDPNFYKTGEKNVTERKELFQYIYKKYFVAPGSNKSEEELSQEMESTFKDLETTHPNLKKLKDGYAPQTTIEENYQDFYYKTLARAIAQRIPTKFIRMEGERSRKVNGLRDRAWDKVYDFALSEEDITFGGQTIRFSLSDRIKEQSEWNTGTGVDTKRESYYQALQDICATGEVLLRRDATETVKAGLKFNGGAMHEVDLKDTYNLTTDRMMQLWDEHKVTLDEDPEKDRIRKLNALKVLKATHKFIYETEEVVKIVDQKNGMYVKESYLDRFAEKYQDGHPYDNGFAYATEELEREFLAHRASGLKQVNRALDDIVDIEQNVVKEISAFYKDLVKVAMDPSHKFDKIVEHIGKIRSPLSSMHSTEYANRVALWMSRIAIAFFKKNSDAESWTTAWKTAGEHHSLASFLTNGMPGRVWEWDRTTIRQFIDELAIKRILPYEPYKVTKHPSFETVYKVNPDGEFEKKADGTLIASHDKRRKNDFEPFANDLVEQFLRNPMMEFLHRVTPYFLILLLTFFIMAAWKGYQAGTGSK